MLLKSAGKDLESADRANRWIHELNLHLDKSAWAPTVHLGPRRDIQLKFIQLLDPR